MRMFYGMARVFQELDNEGRLSERGLSQPLNFLDIGCCPGGFAFYILKRHATAQGTGISLPENQGGHGLQLRKPLRNRLKVITTDILCSLSLERASISPHSHDLVILDGHVLRDYLQLKNTTIHHCVWKHYLLLAPLVLAIRSIKLGGTLVMLLKNPENIDVAQLIWIFDRVSTIIHLVKPKTFHRERGTCYLIAHGVGANDTLE
ncbi:hypothetical protein DL96DRAFT_325891 [Flagelloscypha sp. PMI_526]|nr:hypothetical protein DL96DRAFT_325891 [Flagelloscypha sp. PMI_526]